MGVDSLGRDKRPSVEESTATAEGAQDNKNTASPIRTREASGRRIVCTKTIAFEIPSRRLKPLFVAVIHSAHILVSKSQLFAARSV